LEKINEKKKDANTIKSHKKKQKQNRTTSENRTDLSQFIVDQFFLGLNSLCESQFCGMSKNSFSKNSLYVLHFAKDFHKLST